MTSNQSLGSPRIACLEEANRLRFVHRL